MAEVNEIALMMAIQAVDEKIWALKAQIDQTDEDDDGIGYVADEMLSYMKAAHNLRTSYENALKPSDSLPPYAKLVREP
jgi:hypothetical protein